MKTEAPYQFTVTSSCKKELRRRVFEHIGRGYKPLRFYEIEKEKADTDNSWYRDGFGELHRYSKSSTATTYCADMRGHHKCKS